MNRKHLSQYTFALNSLVLHSKTAINILSSLADKYANHAEEIVKMTEEHFIKVEPYRKLLTIFAIDSILKKVGGIYKNLFEQNIAAMFSSAYERIKSQFELIRLRTYWEGIFSGKTLKLIDTIIKRKLLNICAPGNGSMECDGLSPDNDGSSDDEDKDYVRRNSVKRFRKLKPSPRKSSPATS